MLEWVLLGVLGLAGLGSLNKTTSTTTKIPAPSPPKLPDALDHEFPTKLEIWKDVWRSSVGDGRWIPKGEASQIVVSYPPPVWTGSERANPLKTTSATDLILKELAIRNAAFLNRQRLAQKEFFDTVEKNPLTPEQIHACVCMDDHVLVVAAAGSGKTSTMVAKTGYVLNQGLASAGQILLLAFNKDAATELRERVSERLKGVPCVDDVAIHTFHAFGQKVIASATGKKPSLAPWVDQSGKDIETVEKIALELSKADPTFRHEWDMLRTVYAQSIPANDEHPNARAAFPTAKGDTVKSGGEKQIADWLFYHGVEYEYERPYEHDTADERHSQYKPDFYYPRLNFYHEHFALKKDGESPFGRSYLESVAWKRGLHAERGTDLFETASHEISTGVALQRLRGELTRRGQKLHFDPDRKGDGSSAVTNRALATTIRVFQQHVKNNRLSYGQLRAKLKDLSGNLRNERFELFLSVYERIAEEWDRRLKCSGFIDFEDMLVQATDLVESGRFESPYTIILADEFQDSSKARARLLQALSKNPTVRTHLCVVGDDWQGINRFAGADISVMTEFDRLFDRPTRLNLSETFRFPQRLGDISSAFVQKNPIQIRKKVQTRNAWNKESIFIYAFKDSENPLNHLFDQLSAMHGFASKGRLKPSNGRLVTILILGRYRSDEPAEIDLWNRQFGDHLDISFRTVHGSKGLEADYVFILNVIEGRRGFPSQIEDDPVLQLAMPTPDLFPFSEERRLFYVALTRARRQVRIYTSRSKPSPFVTELTKAWDLKVETGNGELMNACPRCSEGFLVQRQGKTGPFHGCSAYPRCGYMRKIFRAEEMPRN
ncbi:UvrD-helicase domain-containing protein [Microvirga splendida]|uniref:DNA 3'-5' helicase n=1 Tax=Microvirga splendida TaxID=2795727 RepID=A0ABS0XZA9_9HYPH|nr:UvrD-helicase domain-containing protein [Microvirga splendida]MBJ6125397.1 UvrD-helicase domain-containing protein [Microvirga splendida]